MENYKGLAIRTECEYTPALLERSQAHIRLTHSVFGLAGEIAEIREAIKRQDENNIAEEIGDCFWYAAILFDYLGKDMKEDCPYCEADINELVDILESHVCSLVDYTKKTIFYGWEDDDGIFDELAEEIEVDLASLAYAIRLSVTIIKHANIAKLKTRYPNQFSNQDALNRDLTKEEQTLKDNLG